jgi:hypothetical protein
MLRHSLPLDRQPIGDLIYRLILTERTGVGHTDGGTSSGDNQFRVSWFIATGQKK